MLKPALIVFICMVAGVLAVAGIFQVGESMRRGWYGQDRMATPEWINAVTECARVRLEKGGIEPAKIQGESPTPPDRLTVIGFALLQFGLSAAALFLASSVATRLALKFARGSLAPE